MAVMTKNSDWKLEHEHYCTRAKVYVYVVAEINILYFLASWFYFVYVHALVE